MLLSKGLKKCDYMITTVLFRKKKVFYVNPLTAEWALRALIDFTLSNARAFYSSMGNPLAGEGLNKTVWQNND